MIDPYDSYALVTLFSRTFIIKGNADNGKNPLSYSFSILMTPFPVIAFIKNEGTGCINEEALSAINERAIGAIIAGRNPTS